MDPSLAKAERQAKQDAFVRMLSFVKQNFPHGFSKSSRAATTPRVRFEAIAVGVDLAIRGNPNLAPANLTWLTSKEFKGHTTTHGSNSAPRLRGRIEFVRDSLLAAAR